MMRSLPDWLVHCQVMNSKSTLHIRLFFLLRMPKGAAAMASSMVCARILLGCINDFSDVTANGSDGAEIGVGARREHKSMGIPMAGSAVVEHIVKMLALKVCAIDVDDRTGTTKVKLLVTQTCLSNGLAHRPRPPSAQRAPHARQSCLTHTPRTRRP